MATAPDSRHVLRWTLPTTSKRPTYFESMSEIGPTTTTDRRRAMVFASKRLAMMHPANLHPGTGFAPEPLVRP